MSLTILTVCPAELDQSYLRLYREALLRWNGKGLEDTQIILLPQRPLDGKDAEPFEVQETYFDQVNGYPVWDVMKAVREAWPRVRGDYVSFDHPEFIWGPGRLDKTIAWLDAYRPVYGMGNLRRPGEVEEVSKRDSPEDISHRASNWFRRFLEEARWAEGAEAFEVLQTTHWMYWACAQQKPGPNPWIEDAFYARRDWLDSWGFCRYERELPFQDVFDLVQMAVRMLLQYGLVTTCVRMPQSVNKLMHLWHPRDWGSFTPEIRDWFFSQPERWQKTRFIDRRLWDELIAFRGNPKKDCQPVVQLRFGPRGTALNYGCDIAAWLSNGGVETMKTYYEERREAALR